MLSIADIIARDLPANPPEGFHPLLTEGNFAALFGTTYARIDGDKMIMAFRCSPRHCNPTNSCHGGVIASFADLQALGAQHALGYGWTIVPTISLSVEYLSLIVAGDWVEMETTVLRRTQRMVFCSALAKVRGEAVFHSTGIFRIRQGADDIAVRRYKALTGRVPVLPENG